jgi:predicted  nucleic acid-binding Zn-ribbon protein
MTKTFARQARDIDELSEETAVESEKLQELTQQLTELDKEIGTLRQLSDEKDIAIVERETRICEAKRLNLVCEIATLHASFYFKHNND